MFHFGLNIFLFCLSCESKKSNKQITRKAKWGSPARACCCTACMNFLLQCFQFKIQRNTRNNCFPGGICLAQTQVCGQRAGCPTAGGHKDRLVEAGIGSMAWRCQRQLLRSWRGAKLIPSAPPSPHSSVLCDFRGSAWSSHSSQLLSGFQASFTAACVYFLPEF